MSTQPNRRTTNCPLTPALKTLLETAVVLRTTNNKTLADYLCVSEETVKWYLKKIFETLEVGNRTHALVRAREIGVIG